MKVWSMKIMKYKAYIDSICVNFTEQQYKNYGIIPILVLLHTYNRFMIISTLFSHYFIVCPVVKYTIFFMKWLNRR